ncbi:MAG: hypothetical protein R3F20_13085 [Planctomycetota bacterium]
MKTSAVTAPGRGGGSSVAARAAALALAFLPTGLALLWPHAGTAHGDAVHYLGRAEAAAGGELRLAPLEWFHPLFYLLAAGVSRLTGNAASAHRALSLTMHGVLVLAAAGVWTRRGGVLVGLGAAALVATLPALLWLDQDAMSDVTGHGLVALAVLLALRPRASGALAAGILWGCALGVRVSALPFLPILVVLVAGPGATERRRRLAAFAGAALVPPVLLAARVLREHGAARTLEILGRRVGDNRLDVLGLDRLGELVPIWATSLARGLGPLTALVGVLGLGLLLAGSAGAARRRGALALALGLAYLAAVAVNRAGYEFRYLLPLMLLLAFAAPALLVAVARRRGSVAAGLLAAALVGVQLAAGLPGLRDLHARLSFVREAARRAAEAAPEGAVFVGGPVRMWYEREAPGALVIDVRDPAALPLARTAAAHGRSVLTANEAGSAPLREALRAEGFRPETRLEVPAGRLRNLADPFLERFDPAARRGADQPLRLEEWRPPEFSAFDEPLRDGGLKLDLSAPAYAECLVALVAGRPAGAGEGIRLGEVTVPFRRDEIWTRSLAILREAPSRVTLRLDANGRGEFHLDRDHLAALGAAGARLGVLILGPAERLEDARRYFGF